MPGRAGLVRGLLVVKEAFFAVPGDLATPTGGYAYDRRIIAELPAFGWRASGVELGDGFPYPMADARTTACARLSSLAPGHPVVIYGLAFGTLLAASQGRCARHSLIGLVLYLI